MRFFGKIRIRIFDPRSLGSWCIKGTDESTLGKDSSVPLMHHDPSDLGSKSGFGFPKETRLYILHRSTKASSVRSSLSKGLSRLQKGNRRRDLFHETGQAKGTKMWSLLLDILKKMGSSQ